MKSSVVLSQILTEVKGAFLPEYRRAAQYWEHLPLIKKTQARRENGQQRYQNLYDYALQRWGSRLRSQPLSALVLNVSRAPELPEILLATGRFKHILAVDDDAVALQNLLEQKNPYLETWQMDLNRDPLPHGPFDLIVARNALNYLRELEFVGDQIERVLDQSGLFIAREYVGQNRLQFTDEQMQLVNALLALLPARLRHVSQINAPLEKQFAPELAEMLRFDPDKAAQSEELEKMIFLHFRVLEEIPLGGTLLAPLLAGINECFHENDAAADKILHTLLDVEMRLITGGMIRSDYKAYICRRG